ncbi:hypothetical protein [Bacillus sp. 2205SS5-2]|uniref:hypothetical protein n=1 Tax=Bacillus sp. 2205SS5-2 TaxID=3109031 RepID=UPI003004675B
MKDLYTSKSRKIALEMIYHSKNGVCTKRKVIVTSISNTHIRAYCLIRKEIRTFSLANILATQPLPHSDTSFSA